MIRVLLLAPPTPTSELALPSALVAVAVTGLYGDCSLSYRPPSIVPAPKLKNVGAVVFCGVLKLCAGLTEIGISYDKSLQTVTMG